MKKQTEINFSKISKEQINTLTTVVSESIAMDYVPFKTFTTIDLWNIRRKSNSISNRRHLA
ncbi:hypothetical protein BH11BAC5_BH11BAC5_49870 [soil metagenome]